MKLIKKVLAFLGLAIIPFASLQLTNAFQLKIIPNYFEGTNISTWNWAEVAIWDENIWYWAFFLWSWTNTNTTLKIDETRQINCKKKLNWYYTMLFTNFLMLWIDPNTVSITRNWWLTPDTTFNWAWLYYDCKGTGTVPLSINQNLKWIYWWVEWTYWSGNWINTGAIWAWLEKNGSTRTRSNSSQLELVLSTSTWYTSRTLSWNFIGSVAYNASNWNDLFMENSAILWTQRLLYTWQVSPRPIWDIRINNAEKYESWVFVIPYENYQNPWIDISIITSKPNISTNVVMTWQYEKPNSQTGFFSPSLSFYNNLVIPTWSIQNKDIFTWAYWYYWYKNLQYKNTTYRHLSWTLTLNIGDRSRSIKFRVEGWEPCLTWRDNDYFITPEFWKLNRQKRGPTDAQIKCAIFWYEDTRYNESNWAGYNTAYTKWWNGYTSSTCTNVQVVRIWTWNLPTTLTQNRIYVLENTWINLSSNITIPNCTAIISKANVEPFAPWATYTTTHYWKDTTLNKTITINGNNVVLDNISIKWNSSGVNNDWIKINNSKKNITLNVVKVYNNNIWINLLNSSNNIILNNIQSFNNNYWIYLDQNSNNIAINNSQIYRNNTWVVFNKSTNNIIYNSAIYQNRRWLQLSNQSNNNRFESLATYSNKATNGEEQNIFIEKWLSNIWNHIEIWSRNAVTISSTERIRGYTRIEKGQSLYYKRNYKCQWWTEWVCWVNTPNGPDTKYYCTWAITDTYTPTKKNFSADWTYLGDNPRTLSISNEMFANFDMDIINQEAIILDDPEPGFNNPNSTKLEFFWDIQLRRNIDHYEFIWWNNVINWKLTPIPSTTINWKTYTYEVSITYSNDTYPEITFTGYWNEEINYKVVTWTANNEFWVRDLMCEHDGGSSMRTNPWNTKYITDWTEIESPIFTTSSHLDEHICSWANCFTNPKLSSWPYSYLIRWTDYNYWNKWQLIDVNNYSYWIGQKRQENVLLPWWTNGWQVKYNSYFWWYFIWSNVPAQGIERSALQTPSKIHYIIWWRTTHGSYANKFDIISFTERGFPAWTINTIVSYTEWPWSTRPNQIWNQVRSGRTNIFTWLTAGSYTELYLRPWDTNHYPVVLQTYSDKYFATHRWMTRLGRENIKYAVEPDTPRCLPPEQDTLSTKLKWLTHANEWIAFNYERHPLIWANVTWALQSNIQVTRNPVNWWMVTFFDNIDNETWVIKMDLTIPCTIGNVCSTTIKVINPSIIKDILEFPSHGGSITYSRDMKWPDIRMSATWAVECRDATLRLKLNDNCIWASGFMISGFFNTWRLALETSNWWNEDWYDIIIDSWSVGRTWKDENGLALHRTWIIYTRDKYNNETTGFVDLKMVDTKVTSTTWDTITWALDLLNWERIEDHDRSTWINVVELYWVTEWEYCWIQDLYLTWFKCFNYKDDYELWTENRALTWHMAGHILTISPRQETDYYTYQSWIICAINISDNEKNSVTWYMIFNINTVHKPHLFEEPVIIWWTKYSEYSWSEYRNYTKRNSTEYENINTWRYNSYENWKYLSWDYSKYSSGGIVSVSPWDHNKYTKKYHISCTDYYTGTDTSQRKVIPESYPYRMDFDDIDDTENCGTGQIELKVSIWNWGEGWNETIFGNNIDQFATWVTDYIFYDSILPETQNISDKTKKIIITSWHMVKQESIWVRDSEENAVDVRPNIPWYIINSFILNTWIIHLKLSWWTILNSINSAEAKRWWNEYVWNRRAEIKWTITNDTSERVHEEQIYLDIWTWLLHDFSHNQSEPNYTGTRYRYTSENPIYIENTKRWRSNTPENDISMLRVKIDSGVIDTWWLTFYLLSAKPINNIDDIECSLYSNMGWFRCTDILESTGITNERVVCTARNTWDFMPRCTDRTLSDGYNYRLIKDADRDLGRDHRRVQVSRKNKIAFEVYSWEENSWYYNQHTGEREFFGKISIKEDEKIFNDTYAVIKLYENKTPFKEWPLWGEWFYYWDLISALGNWSWDNWFMFYISWPQKINKWWITNWVIWDISYEINFSQPVADEFYYITWEAIVNKFKRTLFIKRPTFNFANPKSYLFNFPDYEWFNP